MDNIRTFASAVVWDLAVTVALVATATTAFCAFAYHQPWFFVGAWVELVLLVVSIAVLRSSHEVA